MRCLVQIWNIGPGELGLVERGVSNNTRKQLMPELEEMTDDELKTKYAVAYNYLDNLRREVLKRGLGAFIEYDGVVGGRTNAQVQVPEARSGRTGGG